MGTGFYLLVNGQKYSISWFKGSGSATLVGAAITGIGIAQAHGSAQEFKQAHGAIGGAVA